MRVWRREKREASVEERRSGEWTESGEARTGKELERSHRRDSEVYLHLARVVVVILHTHNSDPSVNA